MAAGQGPAALGVLTSEIDQLGAAEVQGTAAVTQALLARDRRVVAALAGRNGAAGRALAELRSIVAELDPGSAGPVAGDAGQAAMRRYASRVAAAESELADATTTLDQGRSSLLRENASMAQQERALWLQMGSLRRYGRLAQRLDELLTGRLDALSTTEPDRARRLSADVLYPIRRRRQELLTHLAVASQGYAALRMIEATNAELVRTIDAATSTTTAVVHAARLAVQRMQGARQLGQEVSQVDIRASMAAAIGALTAVNRSRTEVLSAMEASLRALSEDANTFIGAGEPPAGR
jgi:uncharacterized protein YaaN involved in tellurite resistance